MAEKKKKKRAPKKKPVEAKPKESAKKPGRRHNKKYGAPPYKNFDDFWAKKSRELKLPPSMKRVLIAHFRSAGFTTPDKFDEGLKHYGL